MPHQTSKKIRVAILFGGKSAEHEISLLSAKNIYAALDKEKYEPILIGIDKNGHWHLQQEAESLLDNKNPALFALNANAPTVSFLPESQGKLTLQTSTTVLPTIDVVFPVLHGPCGEDGTVQGLLKLANVAFVGSGVLGSAIGMDKDVMKRLLRAANLPVADFRVFVAEDPRPDFQSLVSALGLPFFIKPANMGSSVGVHKVSSAEKFMAALDDAFQYDRKVIIEKFIAGREIECAVLGNAHPIASVPGELIVHEEFYSYHAKYINENGASAQIPADLSPALTLKVQNLALQAFKVLNAEGLARMDFFVQGEEVYINEINTLPGFTSISMYPKLWEASGLPPTALLDKLITLALERFQAEQKLKYSYHF